MAVVPEPLVMFPWQLFIAFESIQRCRYRLKYQIELLVKHCDCSCLLELIVRSCEVVGAMKLLELYLGLHTSIYVRI